jgi:uncharacterized protein
MYYEVIRQCTQALLTIDSYLDKAERYAESNGRDIHDLLQSRLADDMQPFIYQVQSASDYLKAGAAWLSGRRPPKYADNEQTLGEVRERIRKTIEFAQSVTAEEYRNAACRSVAVSWMPDRVIEGEDYLLQITVPNVYFHVTIAYAILRKEGVNVGKRDFLGPMNFVDLPGE